MKHTTTLSLCLSALAGMAALLPTSVASAAPPAGNLAASEAAAAAAPALADPLTDIVTLQEQRDTRLTVPVMIDGQGPFNFMVDTGSQATAVAREINAVLALPPAGRANLQGMASIRPVDLVTIARLDVGKHLIEDLAAPILEAQFIGADGIIGLDSLQDFRVMFDFREPSITLQDMRGAKRKREGFEIIVRANPKSGQLLITKALVEGIETTVIIDTGAQASLASPVLRDKLRAKRETEVLTQDVNGATLLGHLALVRTLKIGALRLSNVPLTFADSPVFAAIGLADQPVLSLGMQHLRLFDRVAIDFANRRIMFDLPRDVMAAQREARRIPFRY